MPEVPGVVELGPLGPEDLRIDTFKSQGAGGQHVNKTDSAVRITHLPTGISAQSQSERSQRQNREAAMAVLRGRLLARAIVEHENELRELRGETAEASWGNQVRSYTQHPSRSVRDHRTGHERADIEAVLDGDLDGFMRAELERRADTS